jgi:hypothetical protein
MGALTAPLKPAGEGAESFDSVGISLNLKKKGVPSAANR